MFTKPGSSLGVGPNKKKSMDVPLKKSDRRALKQAALGMVGEDLREECTATLQHTFLEGTLMQRKLTLPEGKVLLYTRNPSENWPYHSPQIVWISLDHDRTWIHAPSVALLALLPEGSFPIVHVASNTSKYLCRGAHLMRAGILNVPEGAENTRGLVAIYVTGNPQPMAVGRLTKETTSGNIGPETKGIGVMIWSCYGDDIWNSQVPSSKDGDNAAARLSPMGGAPFDHGHYGNVGFVDGKYVLPIVAHNQDEGGAEVQQQGDSVDKGEHTVEQTLDVPSEDVKMQEAPSAPNNSESLKEIENGVNPHDAVLHEAVCRALGSLKKSDLPITTANFYAQHVLADSATHVQLKKTSYKKFGDYLSEQTERDLLVFGPDKDKKDLMAYIVSINRSHPDLKPYKQEHQGTEKSSKKKIVIVDLFVVPYHFVSLMRLDQDDVKAGNAKSVERQGTGMLTAPEVRAILEKYITSNELVDPARPTHIRVDGPLCDALYRKVEGPHPTHVTRKDVTEDWLNKMESAYAVVEMPGNIITTLNRGKPPKVSIEVSRRQGKSTLREFVVWSCSVLIPLGFPKMFQNDSHFPPL